MSKKKKVLFLIPTLGGGGAERVLVNLVNGLDKRKYEITLQSIFKSGVNSQFIDGSITHKQGRVKQFKGSTHLLKLFSRKLLFRLIVGDGYDIVVSYLEGPAARIISGCLDNSVKKVGWIHCVHKNDAEVYHSFRSKKEAEQCYQTFDVVSYVSERVKVEFLRYFPGVKNNKVIHNTNNDELIKAMAQEEITDTVFSKSINVMSVGRLIPVKGYDRLFEAHAKLIQEGLTHHLYVVGNGELETDLKNKAKELSVSDSIHLLGFKNNPYKYVSKADLFICSSYSEGFSTAVTEALILGKPVISTDVSGAKEMLGENNEYGLVVENSTDGIYEGLKSLLQNPSALFQYTQLAQRRGVYFSKENAVKEVENLFDSL